MANDLNMELEGKYVILKGGKGGYKGTEIERVFLCEGGFGCSSGTIGSAIYGKFVFDGEECRIEGYEVERIATVTEVKAARETRNISKNKTMWE